MAYLELKRFIHRDLACRNVLMASVDKVKIGDFGLAKMLDTTSEMANTRRGAIIYMAPERHRGEDYQHKADVWSLGCILYELCTLKFAFTKVPDIIVGQYQPIPEGVHPS